MYEEVLQIKARLDQLEARKMESDLNKRFKRISKGFGNGLKTAITGGAIGALAGSLIAKVLNPLKETEETINKILGSAASVKDQADQYESSSGNVFKLQQLAKAKGVDEQQLGTLLTKFQVALAEAREFQSLSKEKQEEKGPLEGASAIVQNFTDEKDVAEAFYQFQKALRLQTKDAQTMIIKDLFGEKTIGKTFSFLNEDLDALSKQIGARGGDYYTKFIESVDKKSNLQSVLESRRNLDYLPKQASGITEKMIYDMDRSQRVELDKQIDNLAMFDKLKQAQVDINEIKNKFEKGYNMLVSEVIPKAADSFRLLERLIDKIGGKTAEIFGTMDAMSKSKIFKWIPK